MNRRTRTAVDEVTAHLKAKYQAAKAEAAAHRSYTNTVQLMTNSAHAGHQHVPPKGSSKPTKLTANTRSAYGASVLKNRASPCYAPGGARDEARTGAYAAYLKQCNPETPTGCVVVRPDTKHGQATLRRLQNSPLNANTTQGNYNSTVRR